MATNSYRHILKYTGFFGLVQLGSIALNVLRSKLVAVLLGASGVGLIEVFNRTNDLMGALTNLGLPVSGIRQIAQAKGETPAEGLRQNLRYAILILRSWGVVAALLGMAFTLGLAPLLAHLFGDGLVSAGALMCLAPLVGLSTLSGVEWAILKGLQRLRLVALCTLWGTVALLLSAVLCLTLWQAQGIVAMMTLSMLALWGAQVWANRAFAWRVSLHKRVLRPAWRWVRLGIYFNAGIALTSLTELGIRTLLLRQSDLHEVGLYTAGVVLLTAYTRIIFSSAEADFFPRLSATTTTHGLNTTVNRQVEVYSTLMGACLNVLMLALPLLVPLLYTSAFTVVIPMATLAALHMLFKAATMPIAYITLARGDNRQFFILECFDCLTQLAIVPTGYYLGGLSGAGLGLSISYLLYLIYILIATRLRYGYRMGRHTLGLLLAQALLLATHCATAVGTAHTSLFYWLIVLSTTLLSATLAFWHLRRGWRAVD